MERAGGITTGAQWVRPGSWCRSCCEINGVAVWLVPPCAVGCPVAGVAGPRGTLGMDTRPARIMGFVPDASHSSCGPKKRSTSVLFFGPVLDLGLFLSSGFLSVGWIPLWKFFGSPTTDFGLSQSGLVFPNPVLSSQSGSSSLPRWRGAITRYAVEFREVR